MHDGMFQQAHESSYLYANVAEHLMIFELLPFGVGFNAEAPARPHAAPG